MSITEGELTDDQVEKPMVGALTGTIVQAGALLVATQWDEKDACRHGSLHGRLPVHPLKEGP
jgi:hypothetical protein